MEQKVKLTYFNERLNIGLAGIKQVYLLAPAPKPLQAEVFRGKLVYRAKGSSRRYSYDQIKKGLVRKTTILTETIPSWLSN